MAIAQEELTLRYTPLDELTDAFLQGNPKRHDLGQLWDSMQRYGFRDPMAFDAKLNGGKGGIVEGVVVVGNYYHRGATESRHQ